MAQQQTESLSDVNNSEDMTKNCSNNMQNGTDPSSNAGRNSQQQQQSQQQINSRSMQQIQGMSDKANTKSPSGQGGIMHSGGGGGGGAPNNGGGDSQSNPYGAEQHSMVHYPLPMQHNADNPNKDDPYGPQAGGVSHPYSRFHHDPNTPPDPFARYHPPIQPGKPPGILPPNRPPQRFIPGQSPQGPTPTLNSLLQSHPPPPPQHRYPSSYDPQQQSSQQQPTPQSFSPQQSWAPPPRPYSPQLGGSQTYRTPPPTNASRGQSPYPPPGQNSGSYPPSPQQGGPPPPQSQGPATSQYSPYPQRYPTPPAPAGGPNHRSPYPTHQYPEPNRPWPSGPGGPSPAASPGPGGHPHPPASPHQTQHGGPPPSSPGHAPSPSPQPPQASPSPHQELIGQNSNDSSSGGISGVGSGPPGTPNPQQAMRPTPSPTSSSGSRSMSPAVGQQSLSMPPRPSSSQPQTGATQLPPTTSGMISSHSSLVNTQQQQQQHHQQQQQQQQQQHLQSAQHQPPPPSDSSSGSTQRSHNSNSSQQPPTSLSSHQQQQQQSGPTSNSMAAQGSNYQSAPPPISHMHGYKMGPSPGQGSGPNPQSMPPYPPPQSQQYSQGNYPPRPQYPSGYGPTPQAGQPPPANSMTPTGQYANRPLPNHIGGPHSQFPPYQQGWAPPSPQTPTVMSNHVQGKGTPPPSQTNVGSPRPLNYLKQHLQHKGGYVGAPSPTPPQGYGNGPGMHLPMGPPHHMGPPPGPTNMGPPTSAPQSTPPIPSVPVGTNNALDGSSTPDHNSVSQDNGVSSSGSSTTSSHPVTSVITTGPDGAPLDEASQQSTLSNASAASGEDPQCVTPKSRKSESYSQSHLIPPNASPGAHPHGDDFEMNSPSTWPRTAASPVFNSHVPQETYRASPKVNFSKKSDSLCKLYDMDDNPERRVWLDKLLHFMEERRTPITACPTISKQPLDLYRLYLLVKERGGFVEVTKSKTWKDIAGLLGIGASSSAAYTLRKHYTKNLLAFECHFDRGDIDPLPIIQQVEAGSKKKATKAASVPSPGSGTKAGSSNSQDSFPPTGSTSTSMDGYPAYPSNYPAAAQQEYNAPPQMQRPPSQNNAQTPHTGSTQQSGGDNISVSNPFDDPVGASRVPYQPGTNYPPSVSRPPQGTPYQGQASYNQFGGTDQYSSAAPPGQYSQTQSQFPPPNRTMYPPYAPEGEPSVPATSSSYAPYAPSSRPYSQPPTAATQPQTSTAAPAPQGTPGAYPPPPPQQDYYRPTEQIFRNNSSNPVNMSSQLARQLVAPMSPAKPPYQHSTPQPRRHPDFAKESQPYTGYGQRPQVYGGWQNSSGQYRAQYPAQAGAQQWPSGTRPPVPPAPAQPTNQWDQHRYPSQAQQPYPAATQQQWGNMSAPSATNASAALRPPPQRSSGKPFNMPPPQTANKTVPQQQPQSIFGPVGQAPKRDIVFPTDSVEATTPVLYRRKRYTKTDVCPVDPWRIFMALRSGLLAESTWALDILNILLFDDTAVHYFGLQHLPGLLNLLLAHFQKNLSDMFDTGAEKKRNYGWNSQDDESEQADEVDLGQVTNTPNPEERVMLLTSTPNYTMVSRKGVPVRIQNAEEDIFVSELPKRWDHDSNKNYQLSAPVGSDPWIYGHLEPHPHDGLIDVFKAEIVDIPFARYLKSDKKDKLERELDDDDLEGDDSYCELRKGRDRGLFVNRKNKRRINSKNGWTEATKRAKLKECLYENRKLANKGAADNSTGLDEKVKKEPVDSDCREVDMEIEQPRIFNGPQQEESEDKLSLDKQPLDRDNNIKKEGKNDGSSESQFDPKETVRDPSLILKRRRMSEYEDECYTRDEASLYLVNESQDTLARRCICLSNIFRNLTFVPGNETVLAKSSTFLAILGKVLLLNHEHLVRTQKTRNYDREEDTDFADSCSSLQGENEWWWDYLIQIRENMLVAMANIAGHLELSRYEEIITRPVLDGLLHWAVCPSAHGQDPFPSCGPNTSLSPQRLALEALCKLCVTDANVDLVIATPPFSRLEKLCSVLTRHLCRNEDQVLREFSVNLLHYLAAADSAMSRTVALQSPCISYLVAFIEQAEQTALGVANQHGINYLRENPDSMGTSLDMLRRAAGTLLHLSKHADNRPLFMQQEQRLLGLVMSHILDQQVALIISRVLFQISRSVANANSSEYKSQQRRLLNKKTAELQQQQLLTTLQSEDSSSIAPQTLSLSSQLKLENSSASSVTTCSSGGGGGGGGANSNSSFAGTASTNSNSSSAGSPGSTTSSKGDETTTTIPTNLNFGSSSIGSGVGGGSNGAGEGGGSGGSSSSGGGSNKSNNISTTVITNSNNSSSATPTTAAVA